MAVCLGECLVGPSTANSISHVCVSVFSFTRGIELAYDLLIGAGRHMPECLCKSLVFMSVENEPDYSRAGSTSDWVSFDFWLSVNCDSRKTLAFPPLTYIIHWYSFTPLCHLWKIRLWLPSITISSMFHIHSRDQTKPVISHLWFDRMPGNHFPGLSFYKSCIWCTNGQCITDPLQIQLLRTDWSSSGLVPTDWSKKWALH